MTDARAFPRYSGIRTFAGLDHVPLSQIREPIDVAILGVPFDTATSYRPGARFGPQEIRSASVLLRPWHPIHKVDVFASQRVIDAGDIGITPGNAERTTEQIAAALTPLHRAGARSLVLGGDHSIALGELRAVAAVHGPLALVLLDAHADTWDEYYGERIFHGTPFRRALEERLIDPNRSLIAGLRGSLYSDEDLREASEFGFKLISIEELRELRPAEFASQVKLRVGEGPVFLGFDIDVIDPSAAPGTGTPEVGGLSSAEALSLLRALSGIKFAGFDLVEVSPPYDSPGQITTLLAANIAYEMLALSAIGKTRDQSPI